MIVYRQRGNPSSYFVVHKLPFRHLLKQFDLLVPVSDIKLATPYLYRRNVCHSLPLPYHSWLSICLFLTLPEYYLDSRKRRAAGSGLPASQRLRHSHIVLEQLSPIIALGHVQENRLKAANKARVAEESSLPSSKPRSIHAVVHKVHPCRFCCWYRCRRRRRRGNFY